MIGVRRADGTGQAHPPSGPRTPRLPPGMHHSFFLHGLSSFFSASGVPSQGRCSQQTPSGPPCLQAAVASSACVLRAPRCRRWLPGALPAYRPGLRLWPGLGRSLSAPSSPSCTNRVRTRPTVEVLMNSPLAMSWSDNPSSAPSNTSARLTLRADLSPRRAISFRCVRSRSFNSTLYLIAGMSSYVLLLQIIHKTNLFLILVKYTWNRY